MTTVNDMPLRNCETAALPPARKAAPMPDYELIDIAEHPYLFAERKCAMHSPVISDIMGRAFADVQSFMRENRLTPLGAPVSIYYSHDPETIAFRAGFFVSPEDALKASGGVRAARTPAGKVVHYTHVGPYARLSESYHKMMGWTRSSGLQLTVPTWEVYVDDPGTTPEKELRTEVYAAVA